MGSIAVLSPYRAQVDLLRSRCSRLAAQADFSTVDGFQVRALLHTSNLHIQHPAANAMVPLSLSSAVVVDHSI